MKCGIVAAGVLEERRPISKETALKQVVGSALVLILGTGAGAGGSWITGPVIHVDGGASLMDAVRPLEMQMPQPVA